MTVRYEPVASPRYRVEEVDGGELVVIKPRRPIFLLLFLPIWLIGWTAGGVAALVEFIKTQEPFLALWLCGWAVGMVFAVTILCWTIWGRETLRITNGDLEIAYGIFGWSKRSLYQGSTIQHLAPAPQVFPWTAARIDFPVIKASRFGAIKFDYGARTVFAGGGLDEAEGRMIIDRLKRRLPKTSTP